MKFGKTLFGAFFLKGKTKKRSNKDKLESLKKLFFSDNKFFGKVIEIYPVNKENKAFGKGVIAMSEKGEVIRESLFKGFESFAIDKFYLRLEKDGIFQEHMNVPVKKD